VLTVMDFYCGAGGSSSGAELVPGVRVRYAINHWALAIEVHNTNMPHVDHDVIDVTVADPRRYPSTDIGWFSPECFAAGTLVLTERGLVPIQNVNTGDRVLTHVGRYRRVTNTMSRQAPTVLLGGHGNTRGIEVTANHPIWVRTDGASPQWVNVGDVPADGTALWATPNLFPDSDVPRIGGRRPLHVDDPRFAWFVGRWLGDGSLRVRPNGNDETFVTCGNHEADDLAKALSWVHHDCDQCAPELTWSRRQLRTAVAFANSHSELAQWLVRHFGHRAHGKTVPAWVLGAPQAWRRALLDGYLSADGYNDGREWRAASVSKSLALGVRLLAESLGHRTQLQYQHRDTWRIDGRTGRARPQWTVVWLYEQKRPSTVATPMHTWAPVKSIRPASDMTLVYDLTVEEDHSFVADGIVVHNCTTWSVARGERTDYAGQPGLFDEPLPPEAVQRSRVQMEDVPRFSRYHRYKAVVVENVPDILKWAEFDRWLGEMHKLGYRHRVVTVNSAFAHQLGAPAPQLRDRVYVVFWQSRYKAPDLDRWTRPLARCPVCDVDVRAVYAPKPGPRRPMRYGSQYVYRCPSTSCENAVVRPYILPAASAIDWLLPAERIGDRARPLKPKTLARIKAGLVRYSRPAANGNGTASFLAVMRTNAGTQGVDEPLHTVSAGGGHHGLATPLLVPAGGARRREAQTVDRPMATRTATDNDAVVSPFLTVLRSGRPRTIGVDHPMATVVADGSNHALVDPLLVPVEGRENVHARPVTGPARAQTARLQDALVVPLRRNGNARPAGEHPLVTLAAGGYHHALVMRNLTARGDQGQMSTPVNQPLRTILAESKQTLIRWDHVLYGYDTGDLRPLAEPMPTQTTVQGDALLGTAVAVEDCTFRMLDVHEIKAGMAFAPQFVLLGNKRERTRMLGNAVTPPAARDLIAAVAEAITGIDLAGVGR
jgi:DNA (cytosine-5)-methyltransferase 1